MISILIIFSLLFLPIHSSITFTPNPSCNTQQCTEGNQAAFYYANHTIGKNTDHLIFSSFDELTICMFQTSKTSSVIFDYTGIYEKNYTNAIQIPDSAAIDSFTLVIRRLIEFNDPDDKGVMPNNLDPNTTKSYFLSNLTRSNITLQTTNQPSFQYRIDDVWKRKLIY